MEDGLVEGVVIAEVEVAAGGGSIMFDVFVPIVRAMRSVLSRYIWTRRELTWRGRGGMTSMLTYILISSRERVSLSVLTSIPIFAAKEST